MAIKELVEELVPGIIEGNEVDIKCPGFPGTTCMCGAQVPMNKIWGVYHGVRNGTDYPNFQADMEIAIFYLYPYLECPNCGIGIDTFFLMDENDLIVGG
jgi:hypothetical protein